MGAAVFLWRGARASGVKKWLVEGGGGLGRRDARGRCTELRSARGSAVRVFRRDANDANSPSMARLRLSHPSVGGNCCFLAEPQELLNSSQSPLASRLPSPPPPPASLF